MNTIPERIKLAMEVRNKKQIDIVNQTGISKGALSSYLSGLYTPKQDKLQLIADALEVDIKWLMGYNIPMQTPSAIHEFESGNETFPEYVFYNNVGTEYLLDNYNDVYMGLMNEYAALIPRFYILVNTSLNEIHILPLFLKEDCAKFYQCPPEFFHPEKHKIFTRDFESINMILATSHIYYYGIDTESCKPMITELTYSESARCYEYSTEPSRPPIKEFLKELEKEALYLEKKSHNPNSINL